MASTLTDRYIHAATRSVPEKSRADLASELTASISDQVDARIAAGESDAEAERAVLTGLGDPDALAADYTDRPLYLIGPRYFLTWWRLLKLLLWIVPACAAFGIGLGLTISGAPFGEVLGTTIGGTITTTVHLVFWTTLVFVVIERINAYTGDHPLVAWDLDQLPEPRVSGAGFADMVVTIVFMLLGFGAFLWGLFVPVAPGSDVTVLDPGLWPWWTIGLLAVIALAVLVQVLVYLRGQWTIPLAAANSALALVSGVPAVWLLVQGRVLNAQFFTTVIPDDGGEVLQILTIITAFTIAGVTIWTIIDSFLKAHRAR